MKFKTLQNNFYILKLAWKICPGRVLADLFKSFADFASWVFYSIFFIKYIMHAAEVKKSFLEIMIFILVTTILFGLFELFTVWYDNKYRPKTDNIIYKEVNALLFEKATEVELACYEDTEFYNNYTLAIKEADVRIYSVLENFAAILFAVIAGACVLFNMFLIDKYVIVFVLSPLIGNFFFGKKLNQVMYKRDLESVPHQRRMDYVNRTVYLKEYTKEIRTSNIFDVLKDTYEEGYDGILNVIRKYTGKAAFHQFWQNIFTFLVIFQGVMFYSAYRALVSHSIALSDFAVLTSGMVSASWILIGLSNNILTTFQNSLYIENLRKFLEYQPVIKETQEGKAPSKQIKCIELNNVSFRYNGQKEPVIKGMNLHIAEKEKIALVGHNGAGKTTLVKLLLRLYDPESGEIRLNGENIREYQVKGYRRLFGIAFQDYQIFSMTVAENVLMREPESDGDYALVRRSLEKSGVLEKVLSLDKGMDTVLTKEFDENGAVLSGGELQKIAVARAFSKNFEVALFDEPSSALDPIAEYKLYENMMEVCRDKTVVFISHRLSTAVLADRIYMLEDGKVVEEGSHAELMQKDGKYADMFRKQAEKYLKEIDVQ